MAYSLAGDRPNAAAWPSVLFAAVLRPLARLVKARRRRIVLAVLLDMDDYRLWDLGISRSDLTRAVCAEDFDIDAIRDRRRGFGVRL